MKKIINYFLQGLLYIVPIYVTLYVVYWAFNKIDSILPFQKKKSSTILSWDAGSKKVSTQRNKCSQIY